AVKSSVSGSGGERGARAPTAKVGPGGTSMRDSFFGLQTKPTIKPAPFPDRSLALRLVRFYFEHANPQIPILHRGEFMKMFDLVYGDRNHVRTPRESYILNIVFAIGAGIYLGDPNTEPDAPPTEPAPNTSGLGAANRQCQPEEYHASAIMHLEACLQSTGSADRPEGFGGGLEELQAVLLLAGFALLRPVAPGLWYITGVAVRIALDLGLHYEDGKDIDTGLREQKAGKTANGDQESYARERGRREWIRDFRRRLWWSTYSFDRLQARRAPLLPLPPPPVRDPTGLAAPAGTGRARHFCGPTQPLPTGAAGVALPRTVWVVPRLAPGYGRAAVGVEVGGADEARDGCASLSVPAQFAEEFDGAAEVGAGAVGEGEEAVFLKVAEAGQRVLRLYWRLHRVHLVNYTFLATHQLFMAGISFLYAIWHSPTVRSRLTMDEVDFNILAATSVLGDLVEKCPPAEACRDAFDRMAKATVQMCMSTSSLSAAPGLAPLRAPDAPAATPAPRPRLQFGSPGDLYTASPPSGGDSGGVKSERTGGEGAEARPPRDHIMDPMLIPGEEREIPFVGDAGLPVESGDAAYGGYGDMGMSGMNGMEYMGDAGGGLELGFGWGTDGEGHDFGDGANQLDFFDGFYFGTGV
ncbi:hypothetical protein V492_06105, partial [Pseudogymnoascus sp. VKM F-4246]